MTKKLTVRKRLKDSGRYYRQLQDYQLVQMMGTLAIRLMSCEEELRERGCTSLTPPAEVLQYYHLMLLPAIEQATGS